MAMNNPSVHFHPVWKIWNLAEYLCVFELIKFFNIEETAKLFFQLAIKFHSIH